MRENPEQRQVGGGTPSGGALQPRGAQGDLPSHPQGRGGPGTPRSGPPRGCPGGDTCPLPLPQPKHAGGWTGPGGHGCQIAGMQAGTHPEGALAAGRSMKSLGSNPLSLFISSEHEAELGTEVPGTEGTRCVLSWSQPR